MPKVKNMKNQLETSSGKESEALCRAVLSLRNLVEAKRFFRDLLTEPEIDEFSRRWRAAVMLDEGISYLKIQEATGLSSTTVARISDWLNNGTGGYRLMLDRLHGHNAVRRKVFH